MSTAMTPAPEKTEPPERRIVPPLENGDRLTRAEFYRRWEAMPDLKCAERIEGVVYMAAAVRRKSHGHPHGLVLSWLGQFEAETPSTEMGEAATIQLDPDNDPQPDGYLLVLPECGGQCTFTDDDYIENGPELIVEVSASSASRDLHQKFHVYRRGAVKEYVVWKTLEDEIVWFRLQDDVYGEVPPDKDGVFKSEVFPGLWLDAPAMIRGDLKQVIARLREGLAGDAHKAFVEQLESRRTTDGSGLTPQQDRLIRRR